MKINFTRWGRGTFHTPHFSVIVNKPTEFSEGYTQISFVVWNFHWWVIIPSKKPKT